MIPILFIFFLAFLGIYFILMGQVADQLSFSRQRWHLVIFIVGVLAVLTLYIPSPDLFGPDYRFTVSMAQMLIALDLAPLLLFRGIPAMMLQPLQKWDALMRNLAKPILVGIISSAILLIWFIPAIFEAASQSLPLWVYKQTLFLVSGLLLWWPVETPLTQWRMSYALQLLYLFLIRLPMTLLGVIFTFSDQLIYTARSFALEICAPSSISDQRTGGLVMWTIGGLMVFIVFVSVFFRWFNGHDSIESQEVSS